MPVPILILNFNGRSLLAECLPSIVAAAAASRHHAFVGVIDNGSTDDSRSFLAEHYPHVAVFDRPNLGLTSFNTVLAEQEGDVAILLNNDVKLAEDSVDRLVEPLLHQRSGTEPCFMTAPQCRRFDAVAYEGLKTAVQWRWGLVQATCFYPGHETTIERDAWTACAGPVMVVDRRKFLDLGGFDPLYLPGRLEDLDLAFRAWLAGYHACYVHEALAYHLGGATFVDVLGQQGCDELALRNTLLFIWKNLRHPLHLLRHAVGMAVRLAAEPIRALWQPAPLRWMLWRALQAAVRRRRQMAYPTLERDLGYERLAREWAYFSRFHPSSIDRRSAQSVDANTARHAPTILQMAEVKS